MQPVSGGATPLAGASATLPRTSPNQANPTASQQYATLPLHASIPKTEASQSCTAMKMENAPSATSQSSIPAFASTLDDSVTHSVQSNASTANYAALHTQSTFINQGSYPTAVPATVHYAVQVPNYGIPPLPQIAPPPPVNVSFPSQSHTGHFSSSVPPLPPTAPPPSVSVSFPSQLHTGHFPSSIPSLPQTAPPPPPNLSFHSVADDQSHTSHFPLSIPVPNYSTYTTPTNTANDGNPLNSLPVGYSATGSVPGPPSLVNLISTEGAGPPHSYRLYSQYSTLSPSATTSSTEGGVPQHAHTPYNHYATLPPPAITSTSKGDVPFSSNTPYSQYSTHQPSTSTTSTEGNVPPQSHTPHSQYSTFPLSTTTSSTEKTVLQQSYASYSQSSVAPLSTTTSFTEIAALPQAQSLYSQYSALPPTTSTSVSDEAIPPSSHSLYRQYSTLPPSITTHDEADIYSSTDDLLDPIARSRKPNARLSGKKIDLMEVGL